jgi:hypothetical protein
VLAALALLNSKRDPLTCIVQCKLQGLWWLSRMMHAHILALRICLVDRRKAWGEKGAGSLQRSMAMLPEERDKQHYVGLCTDIILIPALRMILGP